jgi:hypothetical protein
MLKLKLLLPILLIPQLLEKKGSERRAKKRRLDLFQALKWRELFVEVLVLLHSPASAFQRHVPDMSEMGASSPVSALTEEDWEAELNLAATFRGQSVLPSENCANPGCKGAYCRAQLECTQCHTARYCDQQCQAEHWPLP